MRRVLATVVLVALAGACSGDDAAGPAAPTGSIAATTTVDAPVARAEIEVLSSPPDMVTGGDALVEVRVEGVAPGDVLVELDGLDVTGQLPVQGDVRRGLVSGLPPGSSELRALAGGVELAALALTDHPRAGPLFAGPHVEPFSCTTAQLGLGPPLDGDCSAPTQVSWWYLGAQGAWHRLAEGEEPPPGAVGPDGEGLVVRRELGTIDRSVYELAVPDAGDRGDPGSPPEGWSGDLVVRFGGGCGTGRSQGNLGAEVLDEDLLARGYMVVTSTFTNFATACDDVLAAEVVAMLREHVVEQYGPLRWVVGDGESGGAIQQHLIVQNYPGLLDAVSTRLSFPDLVTTFQGVGDCGLLARVWDGPLGAVVDGQQRAAVSGHATVRTCLAWQASFLDRFDPTAGCSPAVPDELVYDPDTNPEGVRCTPVDAAPTRYGVDPRSGAAVGPFDNVGVQYGLEALLAGELDVETFLAINEQVGGYDLDGRWQPERTRAPSDVVERMYAEGRVLHGGALGEVPAVDVNLYTDDALDIHDRFRSFAVADRMAAAGVPAGTRVLWTVPGDRALEYLLGRGLRGIPGPGGTADLLVAWLDAAAADTGAGTRAEVLARTRPAGVQQDCLVGDEHLRGKDVYSTANECTEAYPIHGDPRTAAGAPRSLDVLACALAPVDPAAYGTELSDDQLARLRAVFPGGVCDWDRPGVGQVPLDGNWRSY